MNKGKQMHLKITLDEKQETNRITAFLDQISHYGHVIELVFDSGNLIDKSEPVSLDNLPVRRHHLPYIDRVVYDNGEVTATLWQRLVNKNGILRKSR